MKKIIFDSHIFINKFNKEIKKSGIKVPKGTLNTIVTAAKNKFSNKYNNDVILAFDPFKVDGNEYKHFCKIIPETGDLGYEIINAKTSKTEFVFVYTEDKLPDYISTIDDVKNYIIEEIPICDLLALKSAIKESYTSGFSFTELSEFDLIHLTYENELLYCKLNKRSLKIFYIPDKIFELGINPTLNKFLTLSLDDYDINPTTLSDFPTYASDRLDDLMFKITTTLDLSRKEFIHILDKLVHDSFYKYKNYTFSVDSLLVPAFVLQTRETNSLISSKRFVLTIDLLKELFIEIRNFNKTDTNGLNTFQLAEQVADILNVPKQKLFNIFSSVTLAIIENEVKLIDNYKLYIYAKEGKALLYKENTLIEKFSINKQIFNKVRIDYYHYLSNF